MVTEGTVGGVPLPKPVLMRPQRKACRFDDAQPPENRRGRALPTHGIAARAGHREAPSASEIRSPLRANSDAKA